MATLPFDLLVITDTMACHQAGRTVSETIQGMLAGEDGSRVAVLLRDKESPLAEVEKVLQRLMPIVADANASLLIHSYSQLALDYGLLGVHCASTVPLAPLRSQIGSRCLLGASRHDADLLDEQNIGQVDYATISPIFSPTSKPLDNRVTLELTGLKACVQRSVRPLVALGGIQPHHVPGVMAHGAAAIAVSGAILQAESPNHVLKAFQTALLGIAKH
jgi:thiamine-phosphate pyrophosphorylase